MVAHLEVLTQVGLAIWGAARKCQQDNKDELKNSFNNGSEYPDRRGNYRVP
ncbi:hypothetical protein EWM64_g1590 [Hericium alpestre]|uniref:Uncharacterized protein n=1 Tax=Hericium alpestre TaxID=135208 RepID=A0A4Z0A5Y5_9AGAM|nr:hypothetical protein EWM64_g1590 [Hericium alpestre]